MRGKCLYCVSKYAKHSLRAAARKETADFRSSSFCCRCFSGYNSSVFVLSPCSPQYSDEWRSGHAAEFGSVRSAGSLVGWDSFCSLVLDQLRLATKLIVCENYAIYSCLFMFWQNEPNSIGKDDLSRVGGRLREI